MKQFDSFWLILCFLCIQIVSAQNTTEKHIVSSGETVIDIAQKYNVSVEDIQKLNPNIINGISENDVVIIPKLSEQTEINKEVITYIVKTGDTKYSLAHRFGISIAALEAQNPQIISTLQVSEVLHINVNNDDNIAPTDSIYLVKSGDTKYGISKKFGLSISELEALNPQIVPTLKVGQTISVSENPLKTVTENTTDRNQVQIEKPKPEQSKNEVEISEEKNIKEEHNSLTPYISHTIQPGETLYGLSKSAGMSIEEFKALNPILTTSVQAGMTIKMPSKNTIALRNDNSIQLQTTNTYNNFTDLTASLNTNTSKKLMFFLPFSKEDFGEDHIDGTNLSAHITDNRDFFRGALIAIDSARALGLNFNFDIVNTEAANLSSNIIAKAEETNLNSFDAIILPSYEKSAEDVAAIVREKNIPVISVSNLPVHKDLSNLYEPVPSIRVQRKSMLDYLASEKNSNIIIIGEKNEIEHQTSGSSNSKKTNFVEVKDNGTFNSDELISMFQTNAKNYVVIDTDKKGVFISATNVLLRELSNYFIQLAVPEFSFIPDDDDVSIKRFVILKMLYPSLTNENNSVAKRLFKEQYREQYYSEPTAMATYGFDVTFDTLLRLFQSENFAKTLNKTTQYGTLKFDYQKNEYGYYSNFGVNIFQYETSDTHKQMN